MRKFLTAILPCLMLLISAAPATRAQHVSANIIPDSARIQPDQLRALLKSDRAPVVLQVGSHLLFEEAHIPGSKYTGPGSQEIGLKALQQAVSPLPKDRAIVLYCGCCPWDRCPNIAPAWQRLHDMGYSNVKVLYLPNNFGDDWVAKGYPTERH